jgi:hypothetical protein
VREQKTIAIKIIWLIANTIAAVWFSFAALMNPILQAVMRKWGGGSVADRTAFALIGALATFHCVIAIAVCLFVSIGAAVVVTSLTGFGWALMSYFLLQKFADPLDRPLRVHETPMFYPSGALGGFISSTLAIILLADWRWVFLPIMLWLLLGFLCAEIAIRRYMRSGSGCDRNLAIFMINEAQGRGLRSFQDILNLKGMNRYPFP